jgi:hypothetical protein
MLLKWPDLERIERGGSKRSRSSVALYEGHQGAAVKQEWLKVRLRKRERALS